MGINLTETQKKKLLQIVFGVLPDDFKRYTVKVPPVGDVFVHRLEGGKVKFQRDRPFKKGIAAELTELYEQHERLQK